MTTTGSIIASIKLRRERDIVRSLRDCGAYAVVNASRVEQPKRSAGSAFRGLIRGGAVLDGPLVHVWLNEASYRKCVRAERS